MSRAFQMMKSANPNALIGPDYDGSVAMIEDHTDPDGRMYRIELKSTPDACHAIAYCRYNPWGNNPYSYPDSHLKDNGFICLCQNATETLSNSPINLKDAISRARFWCTGYSYLREHGSFPTV